MGVGEVKNYKQLASECECDQVSCLWADSDGSQDSILPQTLEDIGPILPDQ